MQCPYCEKTLDVDWENRLVFFKHVSACFDEHLNRKRTSSNVKQRLDLGYTMKIIKKIKDLFGINSATFPREEDSESTLEECPFCNVVPDDLLDSDLYALKDSHLYACMEKRHRRLSQLKQDIPMLELLNILNNIEEAALRSLYYQTPEKKYCKSTLSAKQLYILFKSNEFFRKFRLVPTVGLINTFWYILDIEKECKIYSHPDINQSVFKHVFFQHKLFIRENTNSELQHYMLTQKGTELQLLLINQPKIDERFMSEVIYEERANVRCPNSSDIRPIVAKMYTYFMRNPVLYTEEIKMFNKVVDFFDFKRRYPDA